MSANLCPRCQQVRVCRPEAIEACPCSTIVLSPAVQAYLAQHYSSCLCLDCLQSLAQTLSPASKTPNHDRTGKSSQLRDSGF